MVVTGPEDLVPDQFTERLRVRGALPFGRVTAVHAGERRTTILSTIVPLRLEYSPNAPSEAPTRLLLKATRGGLDAGLRSVGEREVAFYSHAAPLMPGGPFPRCYDAEYSSGRFHLLLEDLSETHMVLTEWPLPPNVEACERIVDTWAIFHAFWWRHPRTERQQGEMARARLGALVDSSDDAIVSKTLDGIITSWNPAAERMFGWTAAEAVGQHITLIVPLDRRAEENEVLARIRRGERVDHFETVRIARQGQLVDVSITVSPIQDANGRVIGASKIARDISERRRLEEHRTRVLAREQEARLRAEAVNRMKDQLIATVSHELRTPLNSIFGWSRMLQSGQADEAARARAISAIVRNASAQARLIEDLFDLSRVMVGRMRLDLQPVDLNAVVEASVEAVRPAAEAKNLALVVTPDFSLGTIAGAADRLKQIVLNLLTNAVKFTPRNGLVQAAVRRSGPTVDIVVADTGEGIGADTLPHVFEAFRQEDSTSTRAHDGLGLGLALVRELVEAHGGRVRAESPGKGLGSTFTVTLPVGASHHAGETPKDVRVRRVAVGPRCEVFACSWSTMTSNHST